MKRQPAKPVVVERRRRTSSAPAQATATRQPPPDKGTRAWREEHAQANQKPALPKTYTELLQAEIALHVARLRLANDPTVLRQAGERLAHRDAAEREMASIMPLPNYPLGPAYLVFARDGGAFGRLGRALRSQFSRITFIKADKAQDGKSPSSLARYIRNAKGGRD